MNREPRILISLCNVWQPPNPPAQPFNLAIYHPSTEELVPLHLPSAMPKSLGATGLAKSDRHIFVLTQGSPTTTEKGFSFGTYFLLILTRETLSLVNCHKLDRVIDPHSICWVDDRLLIASSGTDEVIAVRLSGNSVVSEECFWRIEPDAPKADIHHINGICTSPDGVIISAFGKRTGQRWDAARDGFIYNITQNRLLVCGLSHPHTPFVFEENSIAYCESGKNRVGVVGDSRQIILGGYSRGLCRVGEHLFAGTSTQRRVSRSLGVAVAGALPTNQVRQTCTINRLLPGDLSLVVSRRLDGSIPEIYDLLPIPEAGLSQAQG